MCIIIFIKRAEGALLTRRTVSSSSSAAAAARAVTAPEDRRGNDNNNIIIIIIKLRDYYYFRKIVDEKRLGGRRGGRRGGAKNVRERAGACVCTRMFAGARVYTVCVVVGPGATTTDAARQCARDTKTFAGRRPERLPR